VDSAADRAAWGIRALIVSGSYGPGDRLPSERDLAREIAVSRPALREGIRRLRSGGVLESRRGSGTYVASIDLLGLFEIRVRLEPLAAERAAQQRNDADLAALARARDGMRDCLDDPAGYDSADATFHAMVARASGSSVLVSTLEMLTELGMLVRTATSTTQSARADFLIDVERIHVAIRRQHPKRAANAMERHILNVRSYYLARVEQGGVEAVAAGA
jgi:GntR family transcriptional regulator, transcriptional repressor for pyruvate dehydrogenase complex